MDKTFFKIVIPNYNGMAYIRQCLDSLLAQTFKDWKCVIVDDLSDDMSYEFAQMYARLHPEHFVVVRAPEKLYAGGCRNIGIDWPIDCEYYYFMDSDDYLANSNALKTIYNALFIDMPDMLLICYDIDINGKIFNPLWNRIKFVKEQYNLARTPWSAAWSRVVKKSKIEYFLEKCMRAEDTYQFLKILDKDPTIKQISDIVYIYRKTAGSAVHSNIFTSHRPIYIKALSELMHKCKNKYVVESIKNRINL